MTDRENATRVEILRILDCIRTHSLDVLKLPLDFTPEDVKKNYRSISILTHPDRCGESIAEQAKTAFAVLNAAKEEMENEESIEIWRKRVERGKKEVIEAKTKELTELKIAETKKLSLDLKADSLKVTEEDVQKDERFYRWVLDIIKEQLLAEEWEKRKIVRARAEEEKERREEIEKRKKTAAVEKAIEQEWESTTDQRHTDWKSYTQTSSRFRRNRRIGAVTNSGLDRLPSYKAAFLEKKP